MATVHIPMADLPMKSEDLLARVPTSGEVVVDAADGRGYRITPLQSKLRTAAEALAILRAMPEARVPVDADWAEDLRSIIAERKLDIGRDPWAE